MTHIFTPTITDIIPADIAVSAHPEVIAKLDAARGALAKFNSYNRCAAVEMAAVALSKSGAAACGIAGATAREEYHPSWDLSTIPDEFIRAEHGRRIKPPAPRARIELPCVQCGHPLSARERRKPCPECASRQPRESNI